MDNLLLISLGAVLGGMLTFGVMAVLAIRSEGREEDAALARGEKNKWLN